MHNAKKERELLKKLDRNLDEAERRLKECQKAETEYKKYQILLDNFVTSKKGTLTLKVTIPEEKFSELLKPSLLSSFEILSSLEDAARKRYKNAIKDFLDCPIIPE